MRRAATAGLRSAWRLLRVPLIPVALYLALYLAISALSERHGFGSPAGLGIVYLAVCGTLLALRVVLLVVLPAALAYRVVAWAVTRVPGRPRR